MSILIEGFIRDESGATAIEYALIAGFVSIATVTAVGGLGSAVNAKFTTVSTALK
jgi:pilus assembly protein Flp/PilA